MSHIDAAAASYSYYPRTMIRLCEISYDDISVIPTEVSTQTDHKVVWGPAQLVSILDIPYSLAFVTYRASHDEYTLVIRGTQMDSWDAWTTEDFAVSPPLVPFTNYVPSAPSNANISQGTANGMNDLLSLVDPTTGEDFVSYLNGVGARYVYVTGHSLGGTLTPPMYLYLMSAVNPIYMANWTFAGLTSGDAGFASFYNRKVDPSFPSRLHNTLDIAPFCWFSYEDVKHIYSKYGLDWSYPVEAFFYDLFNDASGGGYAQTGNDLPLPGQFDHSFPDDDIWTAQALFQHHSTTYRVLVDNQYPSTVSAATATLM